MSSADNTSLLTEATALITSWRNALSLSPAELRPILIACTLAGANFPKLLIPLVQQALTDIAEGSLSISLTPVVSSSDILPNQVHFIRRLREALYKGSALCGGPYGINALGAVNFALDPDLVTAVNNHGPVRGPKNATTPEEYYRRGRDLFQAIYQHHTEPILRKLETAVKIWCKAFSLTHMEEC
ncbi:hypothetical protein BCR41DRAFT_108565 [Lobosporangium transversale]|uniref:Uncharacterized protein n=1 Tax=Lobosporangium transversale TaxID=64571 RepID=A0A1Y2GHD5_9FUNG|nr:hypothetical protein BCR41DRAFT_114622 [Lobosporangium transversale]XP_021879823.1 hypothetical protein BCR41DRAFT_108565 [Lobosporangium transversale]ORZ10968.1 hypothetical protein BCR41DRAFT_114622 [Lobosporangium transversale]ORZ11726.1 hypothetical protein BCR41DRAFT_108565 [Lobosporangium transversale]|eukprot:XP_021879485.1 hypothetical protein BCR41DRAFT_114622 [Lobosporangium transversale]